MPKLMELDLRKVITSQIKDDLDRLVKNLRFPLMVKHPKSYSSIEMTRDSRVDNLEQLHTQFKRIASLFGSARVEEFIVGSRIQCFCGG